MDNEELDGVKFSEFPSQTPVNADEVVGLHSGDNARFSIANIVAAVRNGLANIFVPKTDVGAANGVASLDNTGKVPTNQLPSSTGPEPATATPLMDGTGAVGTSTKYAREDHEHPADTNKQAKITASGLLKGDGQGGVTAATPGTDYATPAQLDGKANQAQLAYVETGTTASRAYAVGEYFCWNGLLYRAKTAIGNGDTFTENTNCFQISRGGLNDISQSIIRGTVKFGNSEQRRDVFFYVTFLSPPTVVATFVGEKNAVRAQVANSSIYVDSTTTTSCKLTIDRTAQSAEVVVNYIAIGDIGLVRNAT